MKPNASQSWVGAGVASAIASSLCCLTPALALFSGISGMASTFAWIEPLRPYLMAISIIVLVVAWYRQLWPVKEDRTDCYCETPAKLPFLQTRFFLSLITGVILVLIALPTYFDLTNSAKSSFSVAEVRTEDHRQKVRFTIEGMTCESCEGHVNRELSKVAGVVSYETSYIDHSSIVTFSQAKTDVKAIEAAIQNTGYKVTSKNEQPLISCKEECLKSSQVCCKKN